MSEWDRLLQQALITLNLLRSSRANPKLSAYAYLHGVFDFNKTPLAPPGTKTIVHNRPANRPSWGYHGEDSFYIGPALDHYRCVTVFVPKTRSTRISDTVMFIPTTIPVPSTTIEDHLRQASSDIVTILSNPPKSHFPTLHLGDETKHAIQQIAELLNRAITKPTKPSTPSTSPSKSVHWKTPLSTTILIPLIGTRKCPNKTNTPYQRLRQSPRVQKAQNIPDPPSPPRVPKGDFQKSDDQQY